MALGEIQSLLWNLTRKQMLKVSDSVLEPKGSQTNIPNSPPAQWCYDVFTPRQDDSHHSENGSGVLRWISVTPRRLSVVLHL